MIAFYIANLLTLRRNFSSLVTDNNLLKYKTLLLIPLTLHAILALSLMNISLSLTKSLHCLNLVILTFVTFIVSVVISILKQWFWRFIMSYDVFSPKDLPFGVLLISFPLRGQIPKRHSKRFLNRRFPAKPTKSVLSPQPFQLSRWNFARWCTAPARTLLKVDNLNF